MRKLREWMDEHLPSWLRVRGEFRERVEGFSNGGFTDGRDNGTCSL